MKQLFSLCLALFASLTVAVLAAQDAPREPEGPRPFVNETSEISGNAPAGPPSVVIDLQDSARKFKEQMDRATKKAKQMALPHPSAVQLQNALVQFKKNPDDPNAQAAFAKATADALEAQKKLLEDFLADRPELESQKSRFEKAMQTSIEAIDKEIQRHTDEAKVAEDKTNELIEEAKKLAEENRKEIEAGDLDPDTDAIFVQINVAINNQKRLRAVRLGRQAAAENRLEEYQTSLDGGLSNFKKIGLNYVSAEADLSYLGEIAAGRSEELRPPPFKFVPVDEIPTVQLPPDIFDGAKKDERKKGGGRVKTTFGGATMALEYLKPNSSEKKSEAKDSAKPKQR